MVRIFDIETGPLPMEELDRIIPEFDPKKVKLGNRTNPAVIAEYIETQRLNHKQSFIDDAAKDALTGRVLAVGMIDPDRTPFALPFSVDAPYRGEVLHGEDEQLILRSFWECYTDGKRRTKMIGFCSNTFDVPFLIQRSWILDVKIPAFMTGRYFDTDLFIDLAERWKCGNRNEYPSLDGVCRGMNIGTKNGSGAEFARLYYEDRNKAIEYLLNDLKLTHRLAVKMGVV